MMALLARMFRTPGSEADPDAWATRFCAHQGLAALLFLLLAAVTDSLGAAVAVTGGYAAWEFAQWQLVRTRQLAWDCLLDWCAWTTMVGATGFASTGDSPWSAACAAGSLLALLAGVWRRG